MKPAPFDYSAPATLAEALATVAQHGSEAKILAGGQSLIPLLNFRLAAPSLLVDLNGIGELDFAEVGDDGALHLGGLVRQRRLERDPSVAAAAPLLAEAAPLIAHPQIRNRGTVGGSLAHADPAAELPVVAVALGARLRLQRQDRERWVEAADFYVGLLTTALEPEEILTEVVFPAQPAGTGWAFLEIARRHGDYAQTGVAALVGVDRSGVCTRARLVYLASGDLPMRATSAAARLVGERPSTELFRAVAEEAATAEIEPSSDIHASAAFKRHLARVITVRALERAFRRAEAA